MAAKKQGKGKERNRAAWWGAYQYDWEPSNFIPAWQPPDYKLEPQVPTPFDADYPRYLPLYVNNDGTAYDGVNVILLTLDSIDSPVGFSQELYILKESWDAVSGDDGVPLSARYGNNFSATPAQYAQFVQKMALVDGNTRPNEAPRLIAGGLFAETAVIIEDAQSQTPPITLDDNSNVFTITSKVDAVYAKAGNDTIIGGDGDDKIFGGAGNDIIRGGNNSSSYYIEETLNGGSGNDVIYGEGGLDGLDGMGGDDILYVDYENFDLDAGAVQSDPNYPTNIASGGSGNDTLYGGISSENLFGDDGNDYLAGMGSSDSLTGGTGNDRFDFYNDRTSGGYNGFYDRISDFNPAEDKLGIYVGSSVYSIFKNAGLTANAVIRPDQFRLATQTASASDRFIYDSTTGNLYFDEDGGNAKAPIHIAELAGKPALDHTSIVTFDDSNRSPAASSPIALPIVQFEAASFQASENAGSGTITLTRTGRITGISQVQLQITGGTATSGLDYAPDNLTVTFNVGEVSKSIALPILQDVQLEQTELVTFSLSSVNNSTLGTIETAIGSVNTTALEILDDDRPTILTGTPRKDRLIGNELDNLIVGNGSNDILSGEGGRDRLFGGKGIDRLKGGADQDIFALEKKSGRDVFQDFRDRQDKLGLTAGLKFKQIRVTQQGKDTLISLGKDQLALLTNVRSNLITKADFVSL